MTRRNRKSISAEIVPASVTSMSHDARGVSRVKGKAVFIDGALPGEDVTFRYLKQHRNYDEGIAQDVLLASAERVTPSCIHFSLCGACSLQHMDGQAQIHHKQKILLETLEHIGKVQPETVMPPMVGAVWGYRRRARLGAKYVAKKQTFMLGFREKRTAVLAELTRCEVLDPRVGERFMALRDLLAQLQARERIPQVEVAMGDDDIALVFRHLAPLEAADIAKLRDYGMQNQIQIYLQPGGVDSIHLLWPEQATLSYTLPEFQVELFFRPGDFTQVNASINRQMVHKAIELLAPTENEEVLDLFCGLGNFTLPLARRAKTVVGVEGEPGLIQRAEQNARHNDIHNAKFYVADLAGDPRKQPWFNRRFDKLLLDPPRAGALEMVRHLDVFAPSRMVYISCNPATLARDANVIVKEHGYHFRSAGVMDMFPHTTHVESIAVFERG